jgi:hypothetical protein
MSTPEAKVKATVKAALVRHGVYPLTDYAAGRVGDNAVGMFWMPVQGPFAVHGVHDFVGVWHGVFFSLETKAPGNSKDATPMQEIFRKAATQCGGISFVGVRDARAVDRVRELVLECAPDGIPMANYWRAQHADQT